MRNRGSAALNMRRTADWPLHATAGFLLPAANFSIFSTRMTSSPPGIDYYLTKPVKKSALVAHILAAQPPGTAPVLPEEVPDQAAAAS